MQLRLLIASLTGLLAVFGANYSGLTTVSYDNTRATTSAESTATSTAQDTNEPEDDRAVVRHQPKPDDVKAIYMTACVAGTPSFRQQLVDLIHETEVNSVIIDVKDFSGTLAFAPSDPAWLPAWQSSKCGARDMQEFVEDLHGMGVFVIARITVFQDPFYAPKHPDLAVQRADGSVWRDYKGLAFIDVGAREYWDHIISLSRDTYNIGFDELNFDYVRYPSDGQMRDIVFPHSESGEYGGDKQANLEAFFQHLDERLADESLFAEYRHVNTGRASATPWTSVDLFGMTTTNTDDLSIGQVIERAVPYFDFIAPMVYPSHYPDSFLGLGNPNDYPYKVVHHAMRAGVARMTASTTVVEGFLHTPVMTENASGTKRFAGRYAKPVYTPEKLRTWIQDFDYGGDYDAADVRAQIQASYDAGVDSWMIWAPSNIYTKAALELAGEDAPETEQLSTIASSTER